MGEYRSGGRGLHRGTGKGRQMSMANSMNAHTGKVWFITGTSTGFGRLLAEEVLKAGGRVIATARKPEQIADLVQQYPETARAFALDVTKPEQIEAVAKDAIAAFGRVDVLVNNAGYGIAGGIEEADRGGVSAGVRDQCVWADPGDAGVSAAVPQAAVGAHRQPVVDGGAGGVGGLGLLQREQVCGGGIQRGAGAARWLRWA